MTGASSLSVGPPCHRPPVVGKGKLIDTATREEDELIETRTDKRAERKAYQARLDALTRQLEGLSAKKLEELALRDETQREVVALQAMGHGPALARQRRLVARMLRLEGVDDLTARLNGLLCAVTGDANHHLLERWRARLVEGGNDALTEFVNAYPHADRQRLRQLVRAASKERNGETPATRHYRALFQFIRTLAETAEPTT